MDRQIEHRRPDIVVMEKTTSKCSMIDVACPIDNNLILVRKEQLHNYFKLRFEIARMWDNESLTLSTPQGFQEMQPRKFLICSSRFKIIQTSFGPISVEQFLSI